MAGVLLDVLLEMVVRLSVCYVPRCPVQPITPPADREDSPVLALHSAQSGRKLPLSASLVFRRLSLRVPCISYITSSHKMNSSCSIQVLYSVCFDVCKCCVSDLLNHSKPHPSDDNEFP